MNAPPGGKVAVGGTSTRVNEAPVAPADFSSMRTRAVIPWTATGVTSAARTVTFGSA